MTTDITDTAEAEESTAADDVAAAAAEELARVEGVRSARSQVSHEGGHATLELVVSPGRRAALPEVTTACDQIAAAVGPLAVREGLRLRCVVRRPTLGSAWRRPVRQWVADPRPAGTGHGGRAGATTR